MNKDIQTLIEREAEKRALESVKLHHSDINSMNAKFEFNSIYNDVMFGVNIALSLFKWRKVTEELPEKGKLKLDINNPCLILAKKQDGQPFTFGLFADIDIAESFEFYGIVEWMPIPQID